MYQNSNTNQETLPLEYQITVPQGHIVRLIKRFVDSIPDSIIYPSALHQSSEGRPATSPRLLLKAILFAYSRGVFTGRKITQMMDENIPMMWLTNNQRCSYHTINSFVSNEKTGQLLKQVYLYFVLELQKQGLISSDSIFIDGTKVEADANKYSFVWKKSTEKFQTKLRARLSELYGELVAADVSPTVTREESQTTDGAKKLKAQLTTTIDQLNQEIAQERPKVGGSQKKQRRRTLKKYLHRLANDYIPRSQKYDNYLTVLGERNSFSKTDQEATFMRLKEDPMLNGQLKAGYNLQIATNNQFVLDYKTFWNPTDTRTLVPFLKQMVILPMFKFITADAGYGSEYNYTTILDQFEQQALIPYNKMRVEMKRSYAKKASNPANWEYNAEDDYYIDDQGVRFNFKRYSVRHDDYGFEKNLKIYEADTFQLTKKATAAAKTKKAKRQRQISVNVTLLYLRNRAKKALLCEPGKTIYKRRKDEVEPVFARLKQNLGFRRTNFRGQRPVENELGLALMALNLERLATLVRQQKIPKLITP